ncbi:hypothetical protein LAG73_14165 [Pseudoxanthomonas japonensis]|nr:hypothetical protein LAG73_14165 [Pseudoxanthomonas japonensis]
MKQFKPPQYVGVPMLVWLLATMAFYAANAWSSGPAYLGDEIGYLTNAAFIAGRFVGGASSYYAGYSFIIAPLFRFLDDPHAVWQGVLILNAMMWGATLALVHGVARRLFPQVSRPILILATILVAMYPGNAVMSGYAFSQTAVAFFFALSVATLFTVDVRRPLSVIPHALLVGLQFWIHPTGAIAPIASLLALLPAALAARCYRVLWVHLLFSACVMAAYRYGVEPWRIAGMTPPGTAAALHYPELGKVAKVLFSPDAWARLMGLALGQLSYSAVASFGVTVLGAVSIIVGCMRKDVREAGEGVAGSSQVRLFFLLAPLGCMAITALTSTSGVPDRLDHWVYGRYQDAFILPLLLYGFLCNRRIWWVLVTACVVALAGAWLSFGLDASGPVNRVNISGMWPEMFLKEGQIVAWLAWGSVGIVAFNALPRYLAWAGAMVLYGLSIASQANWHKMLLETHSNPSELVEFVRGNFDQGCVYFDSASLPRGVSPFSAVGERGYLYSYYFYDYHFIKGKRAADWVDGKCRGVLLTYDADWVDNHTGLSLVGIENQTGLRIIVKDDPRSLRYPTRKRLAKSESEWISTMSGVCLASGNCFSATAGNLADHTQVGELHASGMVSTGKEGFLAFGPYRPLQAGTYEIRLLGDASSLRAAYLDISAKGGAMVLMKEALQPVAPGYLGAWRFVVPEDVTDLEIRVWVNPDDVITLRGYSVTSVSAESPNKGEQE